MSQALSSSRLEAFSDGVIAVIITIMVLELKVPAREIGNIEGLHHALPLLLIYLLSFVQVGIYWVNHHYLMDDVEHVSHGMLWANLVFLFCLSLFPFAASWVGERGISSFSVSLYAAVSTLPAVSWIVLSIIIRRLTGVPPAAGPVKQAVSSALYLGSIGAAWLSPHLALLMLTAVAILWLIPPRRIVEKVRAAKTGAPPAESR